MAERPHRTNRLASFALCVDADLDFSDIEQTENYAQFLKSVMLELADNPHKGTLNSIRKAAGLKPR